VKKNVPTTSFPKRMFATVGNIGIAGDRLVNKQANSQVTNTTTPTPPPDLPTQTIDVCVNGAPGYMVVYGYPPTPY
jgi:hypothetical protein